MCIFVEYLFVDLGCKRYPPWSLLLVVFNAGSRLLVFLCEVVRRLFEESAFEGVVLDV